MFNNVLVIDDEPDILRYLEAALSQEAYNVTTATGGAAALEILRQQDVELVITDMQMPGMNGIQVIRRVKELDPDLEVIVLTGHASLENAILSLREVGAYDYLTKPLEDIEALFMAMEKALEKRRLTLENRALLQSVEEQKQALVRQNRALQESELLKQAILDGITSSLCFISERELKVLWANQATVPAANLPMEELIGRKCPDVWRRSPELNLECPLVMAFKSGKTEQAIMDYPNERILDVRAVPVTDEKDQLLGVLRISDDITDKALAEAAVRESEKKYRELAHSLPVILFEADTQANVTFLNPFAFERLGSSPEDLERGLSLSTLVDTKLWEKGPEDAGKIIQQTPNKVVESTATTRNRDEFPVLLNSYPICIGDRVSGVRGFALDITERKQRREALLRMANLESIGTLVGGIAHDFNNLLSVVLGNLEIAQLSVDPQTPPAEALALAREGCLKAADLTRQFITFSKGGDPVMKAVDLGSLVLETVPLLLSGSNVKCNPLIAEDLWLADLDERQIGQVINNLVQNAVEAMPQGGTVQVRVVNVNVSESAPPVPGLFAGRYIKLEIVDRGTGISEEHKTRVFDPYFSTKTLGTQKGMGLGLSTALSIVEKHGGVLHLRSKIDAGTKASVFLRASQEQIVAETCPVDTAREDALPLTRKKILVMDDEPLLRKLAAKMLHMLGHEAETAEDSQAAVEAYRQSLESSQPFDMVMLDLTVKGGPGGRETIKELLQLNPDVKAMVFSGFADNPVMANYKDYGFCAVLAKPFLKVSLEDALSEVFTEGKGS